LTGTLRAGRSSGSTRPPLSSGQHHPGARGPADLAGEGMVQLEPRRGYVVVAMSRQDIADIYWLQATIAKELASSAWSDSPTRRSTSSSMPTTRWPVPSSTVTLQPSPPPSSGSTVVQPGNRTGQAVMVSAARRALHAPADLRHRHLVGQVTVDTTGASSTRSGTGTRTRWSESSTRSSPTAPSG